MSQIPITGHLLEAIIPPLGATAVALVAEPMRARFEPNKVEQNHKRLQAIREALEQKTYAIPTAVRQKLEEEATLITQSFLVIRKRVDALSRTARNVIQWEQQPFLWRYFTLPRPRRSSGWVATVLCLSFLYLATLTVALVASEIAISSQTELSGLAMPGVVLLLLVVTVLIRFSLAWSSRQRLIRSTKQRAQSSPWQAIRQATAFRDVHEP